MDQSQTVATQDVASNSLYPYLCWICPCQNYCPHCGRAYQPTYPSQPYFGSPGVSTNVPGGIYAGDMPLQTTGYASSVPSTGFVSAANAGCAPTL